MRKDLKKNKNRSPSAADLDHVWIFGKHQVFSVLKGNRRKIFSILATKNSISDLEKFLKDENLAHFKTQIKLVDNSEIEKLVGPHQVHQGLLVKGSKLPIQNQNDLLEELYALDKEQLPPLLLLDQLSDPHNIGAIIRSAAAFGVKKIIFCEHNSPKENSTIVRASAGTIDLVDLVVVINFNNLIEKLKKIGYWIVGLAGEGKASITEIKDYKTIALIIGSEGNGIRDLVKKNCDILAKININQEVESLNASVATAIALYELQG
jgi:23S rRNA (guanosine2251-2'-O)-methyltransferase